MKVIFEIVNKLLVWFISISVGFFIWFGRDVYYTTKSNEKILIQLQTKQDATDKTLDRHEATLTQLISK